MAQQPLSVAEFAAKVKAKYPQYSDVDDYTLTTKMLEKYPEYRGQVDLKKNESAPLGGGESGGVTPSTLPTEPPQGQSILERFPAGQAPRVEQAAPGQPGEPAEARVMRPQMGTGLSEVRPTVRRVQFGEQEKFQRTAPDIAQANIGVQTQGLPQFTQAGIQPAAPTSPIENLPTQTDFEDQAYPSIKKIGVGEPLSTQEFNSIPASVFARRIIEGDTLTSSYLDNVIRDGLGMTEEAPKEQGVARTLPLTYGLETAPPMDYATARAERVTDAAKRKDARRAAGIVSAVADELGKALPEINTQVTQAGQQLTQQVNQLRADAATALSQGRVTQEDYDTYITNLNKSYEDIINSEPFTKVAQLQQTLNRTAAIAAMYNTEIDQDLGIVTFGKVVNNTLMQGVNDVITGGFEFLDTVRDVMRDTVGMDFLSETDYSELWNPRLDVVFGFTGTLTDEELEQIKNPALKTIAEAGVGVISSLPAIATPYGVGMFAQMYGYAANEAREKGMSSGGILLYAGAQASAAAALERFGFRNLMTNKAVVGQIANNALRRLSVTGNKVTVQALERAITNETKAFVPTYISRVAGGFASELETGSAQAISEGLVKTAANLASNTEIFNEEEIGLNLQNILYQGFLEAIGGAMMSSVFGLAGRDRYDFAGMSNKQMEFLSAAIKNNTEFENQFKQHLDNKVALGEISQAESTQIMQRFGDIKEKLNSVPDNYSANDKREVLDLITERTRLEGIVGLLADGTGAAYKNRLEEVNKRIAEIDGKYVSGGEQAGAVEPMQQQPVPPAETKPVLTTAEEEAARQDIESRRQQELEEQKDVLNEAYQAGSTETVEQQINRKYDAEYDALGIPKISTEQQARQEVETYTAGLFSEMRTQETLDPVLATMQNAESLDDAQADNALETIFNEIDRINADETLSPETKKALTNQLYDIAEQIDNYEFRATTETVTIAQADATQRPRKAAYPTSTERYFDGQTATANGQAVTLSVNERGQVVAQAVTPESQIPALEQRKRDLQAKIDGEVKKERGETVAKLRQEQTQVQQQIDQLQAAPVAEQAAPIVLDIPTMGAPTIEFNEDGSFASITYTDRDGNTLTMDGDAGLDLAIKTRMQEVGEVPEQVFQQAVTEAEQEVTVRREYIRERQTQPSETQQQQAVLEGVRDGRTQEEGGQEGTQLRAETQEEVARQYANDLKETKDSDPEQYWSVEPVSEEAAKEGTVIIDEDGGVVVTKEGDIKGLFKRVSSKARGVAQKLLQKAINAGGIKLDNFDTYLTPLYKKAGFRVVSRIPFNEEIAPDGWNKEKHGTPDVVAMVYDPNNELDIQERTFEDYNEAIAYRDSYVKQAQELQERTRLRAQAQEEVVSMGQQAREEVTQPVPDAAAERQRIEAERKAELDRNASQIPDTRDVYESADGQKRYEVTTFRDGSQKVREFTRNPQTSLFKLSNENLSQYSPEQAAQSTTEQKLTELGVENARNLNLTVTPRSEVEQEINKRYDDMLAELPQEPKQVSEKEKLDKIAGSSAIGRKFVNAINAITKALGGRVPVKLLTTQEFIDLTGEDANGAYDKVDKVIYINIGDGTGSNLTQDSVRAVFHEAIHPLLTERFGAVTGEFTKFREDLKKVIRQSFPKAKANTLLSRLDAFENLYKQDGDVVMAEEFMTELTAILTSEDIGVLGNSGFVSKLKALINNLLSKMGVSMRLTTNSDVVNFINETAASLRAGQVIQAKQVAATEKKAVADATERLRLSRKSLDESTDPRDNAQLSKNLNAALVNLAKVYIKQGVRTFDDFTSRAGDALSGISATSIESAWSIASTTPAPFLTIPEGVEVKEGFYSPIQKKITDSTIDKQSANKWLTGGLIGKGDEAVYTGLREWLEAKNPQEQVTKQEILDFLKANPIEVQVVVKGSNKPRITEDDIVDARDYNGDDGWVIRVEFEDGAYVDIKPDETEDINEAKRLAVEEYNMSIPVLDTTGDTMYSEYQLEGEKSNYQEVLVTLPILESQKNEIDRLAAEAKSAEELADNMFSRSDIGFSEDALNNGYSNETNKSMIAVQALTVAMYQGDSWGRRQVEDRLKYLVGDENFERAKTLGEEVNEAYKNAQRKRAESPEGIFKSPHFDVPNILVHLRINIRTDADGNKVLFVEEVQSDWAQVGRRKGFVSDKSKLQELEAQLDEVDKKLNPLLNRLYTMRKADPFSVYRQEGLRLEEEIRPLKDRRDAISREINKLEDGVPPAPFVTNTNEWVRLGLKEAVKQAVAQGANKIAWTNGQQQIDRYDLSKQIDEIQYFKRTDGYSIVAIKDGVQVFSELAPTIERVADVVGKDIAQKIENGEGDAGVGGGKVLKNQDLKVGGTGMKAFYDGIVPNAASALVKELTGEQGNVGEVTLQEGTTQQSINITPEIAAQVEAGVPLFKGDADVVTKSAVEQAKQQVRDVYTYEQAQQDEGISESRFSFSRVSTPISMQDIVKGTKSKLREYWTAKGNLPKVVFDKYLKLVGEESAVLKKIDRQRAQVERIVKKEFGQGYDKLDPAIKDLMDKALRGDMNALISLPTDVATVINDMRHQVDAMSQAAINLGMLSNDMVATFQNNMGVYLTRSYRKFNDPRWVKNVPDQVRQDAEAFLRREYPNLTDAEIQGELNYYLTTRESIGNIFKQSPLGSKNINILKNRKDIPKEIRDLLGEYTDPFINYSASMMQLSQLTARQKFLEGVKQEGLGVFLFNVPTGEYFEPIAGEGSKTMSPLNGLFTTKEIADAFNGALNPKSTDFSGVTGSIYLGYLMANAFVKTGKTVLAVESQIRNFWSNFMFMVNNAYIFDAAAYKGLLTSFVTIKQDLLKTGDKSFEDYLLKLTALKVVDESVNANDITQLIKDIDFQQGSWLDALNATVAAKVLKAPVKVAAKVYQASDDFFKIVAYETERQRLIDAYGTTKTMEWIETRAAEKVRTVLPTYSLVPKIIKEFRKTPLVGTFVSFPYEVLRSYFQTIRLSLNEMGTKEEAAIGRKRMAGIVLNTLLIPAASMVSQIVQGVDDDEEEALRRFLPPWSRTSDLFFLDRDENGLPKYIDLGYSDPYNYIRKPMNAIIFGLRSEDELDDAFIEATGQLFAPFLTPEILAGTIMEAITNKKMDSGDQVYNPALPVSERYTEATLHILKALEPSTINTFRKIHKAYTGEVMRSGVAYNMSDVLKGIATGQRIYSIDPMYANIFKFNEAGQMFLDAKKIYNSAYYNERSTREDIEEAYNKSIESQQMTYRDIKKDYDAALKLMAPTMGVGAAKRELFLMLGDAKIPGHIKAALHKGMDYIPYRQKP